MSAVLCMRVECVSPCPQLHHSAFAGGGGDENIEAQTTRAPKWKSATKIASERKSQHVTSQRKCAHCARGRGGGLTSALSPSLGSDKAASPECWVVCGRLLETALDVRAKHHQ